MLTLRASEEGCKNNVYIGSIGQAFVTIPELSAKTGGAIARPGISPGFLVRHNIRHVDETQAELLTGFKTSALYP